MMIFLKQMMTTDNDIVVPQVNDDIFFGDVMKRGFGSDNHSGVCPEVLEAIARVNKDHAVAYGDDEYCAATEQKFREQFGKKARVFFAFNGTGCNTLCISTRNNTVYGKCGIILS